jgi:hypothetical protein
MKKQLVLSIILLASFTASANTIFTGKQSRGNHTCTLEVLHTYSTDPSNEQATEMADVRITFIDGGHGSTEREELDFTISLNPTGNILSSTGANGRDLLQVEITSGTRGFAAPVKYGARFVHGNHMHSVQCLNLSL